MVVRHGGAGRSLPCTKSSGKRAMQPLPAPLVPHILLPDRHERAIISDVRVERGQRCSKKDKRRLLRREISLEVCTGPLVGHGAYGRAGEHEAGMSGHLWRGGGAASSVREVSVTEAKFNW